MFPTQEYEAFRSQLLALSQEFDNAGASFPSLYHQWIWGEKGMRTSGWDAFFFANSHPDGDWQEWMVVPRGNALSRFHGFEDGLEPFCQLAGRGYALLKRLHDRLHHHPEHPNGLILSLPKESALHGWLESVYLTARCYATALVSERSGKWGCSGQATEDDSWVTTENGHRFPLHPDFEELVHNVFDSSAEAIRLWLQPGRAIQIGEFLEDVRIALPATRTVQESRPFYDISRGELSVGGFLVKRFRNAADNQRLVLSAFQSKNWLPRIDDPLPNDLMKATVLDKRIRDTVQQLNRNHEAPSLIRFYSDGTGKGFIWEFGDGVAALPGFLTASGASPVDEKRGSEQDGTD